MPGLVLVLWALLVSSDCAGGATEPGENLSCYQCFKVTSGQLCKPTACASTDRVCISHAVIVTLRLRTGILLSKRCAPRCPNTNMQLEWSPGPGVLRKVTRQCCSGSLCNRAPPLQEGPWALPKGLLLPLGLGLLWVLL
ncbi:lymphocyte antigen 6L [Hippopotamus amphibius kiboko]|uniref:lymphocyte antigen 6L n=1 Tax=Hippopotamus amphibius kiboko TaxID=575201 RepID=UPI0025976179|nr:lymphocyte antigen 6L [Hippopotamus amphibius kiboko]